MYLPFNQYCFQTLTVCSNFSLRMTFLRSPTRHTICRRSTWTVQKPILLVLMSSVHFTRARFFRHSLCEYYRRSHGQISAIIDMSCFQWRQILHCPVTPCSFNYEKVNINPNFAFCIYLQFGFMVKPWLQFCRPKMNNYNFSPA